MQVQHLPGPIFALLFIGFLTGCQLLAPYKSPITPTPNEWKTNYNAPDEGVPTIPTHAKEAQIEQPKSLNEPDHLNPPPIESNEKIESDINEEPQPKFEEVRRDLTNWWEVFEDPILNELEQQALDSSYTLWAALERVIQARSQAAIDFSPLLPNIQFNPSVARIGSLYQNPYSTGNSGGSGSSGKTKIPHSLAEWEKMAKTAKAASKASPNSTTNLADFRFIQSQYLVPLNLNYELDIWSQLHNSYYATLNTAQASYQAYLSVLLSLTADVAAAYFQVRGLDAQQEVVEGNIRVREDAVKLNTARYQAGLIVYLDVSRAEVELARARSDKQDVKRLRGLQENLLATLVGVPASIFNVAYNPLKIPPPVIPRGLPSELLCRRPDIAESERKLAASYREVGVAYANFFPSFNLNAVLGFESPFSQQLFSWRSRLWQFGIQLAQTVFDGGRNNANYEFYQSRFREAIDDYQTTVLNAFKDVEDALTDLNGYANRAQDLANAVKFSRITFDLAQMRYNRGLTNYLDVVDAERQLLETEQNAVIVLGRRYISTVMLIRALGGCWGVCASCDGEVSDLASSHF
ncbi:MAG: efflux transporter outer membrane subunit [Parachlamydiaceae bacterium]